MIRKASLADVQQLVDLGRIMAAESPRFKQFAFCEQTLCESLAGFVQDPECLAMVAEDGGGIVGVIIGRAGRAWFSSDITASDVVFFVHPAHRGKTHAPRLVKAYMDWAEAIGAVAPILGVSSMVGTQKTVDFLTRMGMQPCGIVFGVLTMCFGLEFAAVASLAGTALSTVAAVNSYNDQQDQANENAQLEREAADEQAKRVRMAVEREKSSARAATAASGTQLDEFASINIDAIERLGASDEAMTRLSGARRARREEQSAENYGNAATASGFAGFASMAGMTAKSNWRAPRAPAAKGYP